MYSLGFYILRGLSPLSDEQVLQLYGGTFHVPLQQDSGFYGKVSRCLVLRCRHLLLCSTCIWFGTDRNNQLVHLAMFKSYLTGFQTGIKPRINSVSRDVSSVRLWMALLLHKSKSSYRICSIESAAGSVPVLKKLDHMMSAQRNNPFLL